MKVKEKIVREARFKKEYSQEYIADVLNISQSKYSRLEKGELSFGIDELSKLIDLLELNPLDVLDFTEQQQEFIDSSSSDNTNNSINDIDKDSIRELIKEELKKF